MFTFEWTIPQLWPMSTREGTRSPSLTAQALELWSVVLEKGIWLTAQHIPGIQNVDTASRQLEARTGWTLNKDLEQGDFSFNLPEVLPTGNRPICLSVEPPGTEIRVQVPRSRGLGSRRLPAGLEQMDISDTSAHNSSSSCTKEDQRGADDDSVNSTKLVSTMVSRPHPDAGGLSSAPTSGQIPLVPTTPTISTPALIRERYGTADLSEEVVEILLAS
jgi:hypothetical protein